MALIDTFVLLKCLTIFSVSLGLNFLLVYYQKRINILDIPNDRSSHDRVVPRSGGIAIFSAFVYAFVLFNPLENAIALLPLTLVFITGLWDDIRSVPARLKLLITACAGGLLYLNGFDIQRFGIFFGHEIVFTFWAALAFCAFAISGFVSALNLIDGLDGLASCIALVILAAFAYIGWKYEDLFLFYTSVGLISALIGFLVLNWHPAKIFMGDSGSLTIGFIIAMLTLYSIQKAYITAISILLLAAIPILDTLIVMLRRILNHQSPLHADKTHIHHMIFQLQNGNTRRTVIILGLLQGFFSYIGLGFKVRDDVYIFFLYALCFTIFYLLLTPKRGA